jgi:hypothetical protein
MSKEGLMELVKGSAALLVFGFSLVMASSLSMRSSSILTSRFWTTELIFYDHLP